MKKSKIEIGQCYEYYDRVFMVIDGPIFYNKRPFWIMQNTLTKESGYTWDEVGILRLRRPFQNEG